MDKDRDDKDYAAFLARLRVGLVRVADADGRIWWIRAKDAASSS